jgi:hypothetical protein
VRSLAVLFATLLAGCTPSAVSEGSGGTTCTSAASDSCSADQPSLVTCPAGVAFDAGALTCSRSYIDEDPGATAYCCGACTFVASSPVCVDGGGQLVTCPSSTFATAGCTALFDAAAGTETAYEWCCPPEPD